VKRSVVSSLSPKRVAGRDRVAAVERGRTPAQEPAVRLDGDEFVEAVQVDHLSNDVVRGEPDLEITVERDEALWCQRLRRVSPFELVSRLAIEGASASGPAFAVRLRARGACVSSDDATPAVVGSTSAGSSPSGAHG
jgi:hypothetical protein